MKQTRGRPRIQVSPRETFWLRQRLSLAVQRDSVVSVFCGERNKQTLDIQRNIQVQGRVLAGRVRTFTE